MQADDVLNFNVKPKVYTAPSKIKDIGDGLFAKQYIPKDTPVVVYYGDKITDEEIYNMYMKDPDNYREISNHIRGTPNGYAVKGDRSLSNHNLLGVYVNDIGSITCKKEDLTEKIMQDYAQTYKQCNLKVVDTEDYPVYVSVKRIKKHDELYIHYGIGYWLGHIGFSPQDISKINKRCNFSSYYNS